MFNKKSTLFLALFVISAQLTIAAPPACLLAAVNTQPKPADLDALCGKDSSEVQDQIRNLCDNYVEAALDAYRSTCKAVGKDISVASTISKASKTSSSSSAPKSTTSKASKAPSSLPRSSIESNLSDFTSSAKSESPSETTASPSASVTSVPYPVTYTSTYYDNKCSCTKIAAISSTGIIGSSGFASVTGIASTGFALPTGSPDSNPSSSAIGYPILPPLPSGTRESGNSSNPTIFEGAAPKNIGSYTAGVLALVGLALAL